MKTILFVSLPKHVHKFNWVREKGLGGVLVVGINKKQHNRKRWKCQLIYTKSSTSSIYQYKAVVTVMQTCAFLTTMFTLHCGDKRNCYNLLLTPQTPTPPFPLETRQVSKYFYNCLNHLAMRSLPDVCHFRNRHNLQVCIAINNDENYCF